MPRSITKTLLALPHERFLWGPYLAKFKVSSSWCKQFLDLGQSLRKNEKNRKAARKILAGQIKEEYLFDLDKHFWIKEDIAPYVHSWITGYKSISNDTMGENPNASKEIKLVSCWINYMKAGEYNPSHIHWGATLSFVLYLKNPPHFPETHDTNTSTPGTITFCYGESMNFVISERAFLPEENTLFMFPYHLRHSVLHFNGPGERISVSGNIVVS